MNGYNQPTYDQHYDEDYGPVFSLDKPDVRMSFIRKVYLILSAQLTLSALLVTLSVYSEGYRNFLQNNIWLLIVAAITSVITSYALICYKSCARTVPQNYVLLSLFTASEAYMISCITLEAKPILVFIAALLTAGIVVSLTIYAITTKRDFTMCGGLLFMFLMTLFLASFLLFFIHNKVLEIIISAFSVILFGIYLIYDTQLIIGGRNRELSVDDYIIGALMLYIDIVRIFIEILRILSVLTNNN